MPNNNDTKKLYDALQRDGYEDLGTLEEFTQKVQDRNNSDKLFNALQQDGYSDLGTQEDFYNRLHEAPAAKVDAPDTVEISGDGTFTEEQLAAVEAGAVPVVKQEPPAYGSPEWLQSRIADDINPSNPYNGMTRQEAINAIGKKYFNEWYGNGPGAYDKIKQEATYITDDPEVINHLPVDVRNTFISPVARKRIEQLMGSFKEVNWSNAEDILSVLDSRETQQAIESDLSKLGMRNTADMFDDAEAKEKAEADYRASRDAYYNTLREGLTGLLVEKYGYLPTTDARSDAGWLSSALIAGSGDAHEDRIRSREAVGLTQKYLSGDINATIAQYDDVADAIVAEHNASVSPYADPGMDFGAIFAVRKGNEARDPDKVLEDLTSRAKTLYENMQGNEQFMQEVAKKAESLGMSTYHYLRQYVAPTFVEALQRRFQQTMIAREMPKSKVEYVLRGIEDSVLGMVARGMMYTDSQQQYRYMADAQTAAGGNPSVDPGIWAQGSRLATGMASDFWLWAGWGQLGSKLTGQLLSQRVSALAAEKGITEAAARRLLEEEGKHYLKKGVVEGMMRHIPSSAVTMGGAEGTTELVRSVRDNEKLGDIISNTMGATMRGATTGTAFGVTGGIMGRATSQLSGGWRLAGRLAGLEVEAGTMYTVEELHRMAAGEEAFENPFEGMLQTNIKLGFIKASANPIATIGKFAHALSHPVKTIKGGMKPDVGTLTEEDVTDLMQSQGGKDLVESITKMRPEKYNRAEGERQGAISREEAERAAEAYRNYMSDPERPFERKQRVARLLGGIVPPPGREVRTFSELLDDDTYVLRTYDIDGQCVRELHFKTIDELSAAENGMQADIDRNITESLAQKIDMYDSYQRYGTYLNEEYQRAAEKLRMGEELTDGERQVVYLYQHQGDLIDIRNKISDGEQLSQEEQRLGDIYEARFEDYVRSGKAMRDRIAQYESSGEASEASERSEARDTGERAGLLEARESGGANGEAGPQDEAGVHEPSAPTPTASYVRGQDAIKNGDADAVRGIGHDAYLAKARIERLFGNDQAQMQQVFKAVEQGKAEDFLTANAETLKQPQVDAVRKLEDAFDAMRGVDDAVEAELSAIVRQSEEDIKPYQNEQGEIVPIKLVNGVTVYHKNGDLNNQYGTINIVYTGQDGQPKNAQVSYKDILEVAQPMSPEAFVERISQENRAATEQKYRKWAEGNDLSKGSSFEITVGGTIVPVHSEGLFANGDVQIAFEDGSIMRMSQADVLIGIAEAQKMRVDEEVNSEMAAWREQVRQRHEEERAAAEKERQARFEKGIVGYGEGKPDYSSSDSDPAVVAEYLLSMAKSEGETGKVADSREQVLKNIQDEKELLLQNAMQFQRDFDEAQDWLDTNEDIADALEQAKAIQKRRRAEVKLDEIASRQLQWAAIRDQIMTKDEKESFMQERRHHLSTLRPKEIALPDNIQPYQTVYEENGIDVTKTEDIDKFLLDNYKEQGEAETAVNEQRIALRNYQRDHVQPDISRMQQVVDDYVQGRTELTDEVLTQLMTAIGEGEAYQSMLNQKARDLKAIVDRLPRTYAERNKAIFDEMPAADQRLSRFEQARTQQDKIRIAREVYGSDPVAAAYFDDMDVPLNAMELVAMNIPLRGISWEGYDKGEHHVRGLQEELGKNFTRGVGKGSDVNSFHTYLAPKGQGRGVDEVVHSIYEAQSDVDGEKLYDTQDIRNALIELITTASKPSDIRDYVIDRRIEAAEEVMRATEEYEAREAEMAEMGMPEQDDIDDWLTQQYKWLTPEVQNYFDGLYAEYVESLAGDPATYEDAIRQLVTQDAEQFNSIDYGRQRDNEAANGRGDRMDSVADTGAGEERGREGQEAVSGAQPDNEVRPVEHQEQVPAASGNESSLAGDAESVPVSKESGKRSTIQGLEDYTESEVKDIVRSFVEQQISESEADAEIVDIKIIGSRTTGNAKDGSDLDVLLEYKGTQREDDFFNLLHDTEEPLLIDGIQVDINPITKGKSGTIEEFMRRNADYSKEAPSFSVRLEAAKAETATNPTEEQKKAGNYKKGHITFGGYRMSIENPKGSVRSGVDRSGKPWSITMHDTYGYIGKKYGADGDHLDFFINDDADLDTWNSRVFIVDQKNEDGTFDEHKVLYGYLNWAAAKKAYEANYEPGWWDKHVMQMMGVRKPDFDKWLNDSDRKRKPFAEYFRTRILSETVSDPVTEVMADINDRQKVPTLNALGVREDTDLGKRFTSLKQKHPDTVLIFKTDGGFKAIGVDAPIVGQVASQSPVMVDGVQSVTFSYDDLGIILPALIKSGHHVAVSEPIEEPKAVKKLKIQGVSKKTQPKSGDTSDIDFMIGDIVSEDAPSEKISYKEYAFGNNFIPLQAEDVVTVVSVQRATMSATAPWREGVEDVTVHTTLSAIRKKYGELHQRAKEGDVEAADELVSSVVKPEKIAAIVAQHPNARVAYVHAEEATGRNSLPVAYAHQFKRQGLQLSDIVQTNKPEHTGSDRTGRFIRRARFNGEVESGREYIIVDDHITMGSTLRDLKDYIESKGGKVVAVSTLTASAGGTKLRPTEEQIHQLKEKGVTNEQLREIGIADNTEGLTRREAAEILVLVDKGRNSRSPRRREEERSRFGRSLGETQGKGVPERLADETRVIHLPRIDDNGYNVNTPIGRKMSRLKQEAGKAGLVGYTDSETGEYVFLGNDAEVIDQSIKLREKVSGKQDGMSMLRIPSDSFDLVTPTMVKKGYKIGIVDDKVDDVDRLIAESQRRVDVADKQEADKTISDYLKVHPQDSEAEQVKKRATKAVLTALDDAGVPYKLVSDKEEREMLSVFSQMNVEAIKTFARNPSIRNTSPHGRGRFIVFNMENPFGVPMYAEKKSVANWILEGVKKYGGKWAILDIGYPGEEQRTGINNAADMQAQIGWHGSHAVFTRFDHSHMGEGAGSQTFGWGTYLTNGRLVAQGYANPKFFDQLSYSSYLDDKKWIDENDTFEKYLANNKERTERVVEYLQKNVEAATDPDVKKFYEEEIDKAQERISESYYERTFATIKSAFDHKYGTGHLYKVEMPDDSGENYLEYYEKMRDRQAVMGKVDTYLTSKGWQKEQLDSRTRYTKGDKQIILTPNQSGADLYAEFEELYGAKGASKLLHEAGLTGIKYPAGTILGGGEGATNYVMFDEDDAKITEHYQMMMGDVTYPAASPSPVFVSNALKAVEGIKQEKATPEQWLAMLIKNGGLKAGEDKWLGLTEWLNEHKGQKLTKQDVIDFIHANQIEIEEQHYSESIDIDRNPKMVTFRQEYQASVDKYDNQRNEVSREIEDFNQQMYEKYGNGWSSNRKVLDEADRKRDIELSSRYAFLYNSDVEELAFSDLVKKYGNDFAQAFHVDYGNGKLEPREDMYGSVSQAAINFLGSRERPIQHIRLSYTTEELENKREIALTVPSIESWKEDDKIHFGDAGNGRAVAWIRFGDVTISEKSETHEASKQKLDAYHQRMHEKYGFTSDPMSWDMSVMTDDEIAEGDALEAEYERTFHDSQKKVLVIDEIQSKRHQEGREHGYAGPEREQLKKKVADLQEEVDNYRKVLMRKYIGPQAQWGVFSEGVLLEEADREEWTKLSTLTTELKNAQKELKKDSVRVPNAPFEKNWHELAMKRMLRYAAENGYDAIAWTTGQQQAARYNLSEVVERIDIAEWGEDINGGKLEVEQGYKGPSSYTPENDVEKAIKEYIEYCMANGESFLRSVGYAHNQITDAPSESVGWTNEAVEKVADAIEEELTGYKDAKGVLIDLNDGELIDITVNRDGKVLESSKTDYKGHSLSDIVGKEMALKIIDSRRGTISGEGLRIGGEGMKGFYDEILPRFMNKYGKRWGIKVYDRDYEVSDNGHVDDSGKMVYTTHHTWHTVDVTADMRESVMQGQPMFQKEQGGIYGWTDGKTISLTKLGLNPNSPVHEYTHIWASYMEKNNPDLWSDIVHVMKQTEMWEQIRKNPNYRGIWENENKMASEVLSRLSGAQSEEEFTQAAAGNKKSARELIKSVKSALKKFWDAIVRLFSGRSRTAARPSSSLQAVVRMPLRDLLEGFNPVGETSAEMAVMPHMGNEERTLMAVHNISEDKLKKAIKLGGLANPGLAVIDTKQGIHSDFGDISLIPTSALVDTKTGRNAGTYTGDAYTATYPSVSRELTRKGDAHRKAIAKEAANKFDKGNVELESRLASSIFDYIDGNGDHMHLLYMIQKGLNPKLRNQRIDHTHEEYEALEKIFGKGFQWVDELTDEQNDALLKIMMDGAEEYAKKQASNIKDPATRQKAINYVINSRRKALADENGKLYFAKWNTYVHDVMVDERNRKNPKIDWYGTNLDAANYVLDNKLQEDYEQWKEELFDDGDIRERLFAGWTPDGDKRYVTNTVQNASRIMNRESDTNAHDEGGLNATRSPLLTKMKTLSEIRKHRELLRGKDEYSAAQKEMSDELLDIISQLSDMQVIDSNSFMNRDYAEARLQEAITTRDPIGHLNREYGYNIARDSEFAHQIMNFIDRAKNLPVKYFETKFKRPVMLSEFAVAVVPETTSQEVIKALQDAGLDVRTYDNSSYDTAEANRRAVTLEAVQDRDDIMFQIGNDASDFSIRQESAPVMTQEHDKQQEAWMVATQSVMRTLQDGKIPFDVVSQDEAARVLATQRSTGLEHGKQLLRTSSGVIYGYADHNGIHLTEAGINPETGAHEYGHLWVKALKRERPDLWSNIKSLMKEDTVSQRLYEKLLGNESYRQIHDDEDRLYEEVLTTMAGKKNRERFEQAAREMLEEAEGNAADTASGTSAVMRVLSRIRNAFHKLWSWVGKSLFGIKSFRSVDEVTDRMMYDFVNGTKLSPDEKSEADFQIGRGKPRQKKNESMAQYIQRLREWERRRIVEETDPEPQKPDNDTDPFSDDFRVAMDEWRRAHEEWEIRNQLREEENIDMRLYDEATAPEEAAPEESNVSAEQRESEALLESEVDARVMRDLGDAVGYDTTPEGVREHVRLAVIDRRKNLESASAEDALWLHDLSMRINEIAKHQGVKPQYLRDNLADIIEGTYFEDVLKDEDGNIVSIEDISDQLPVKKDDELTALLDDIKAWYDEFYHLIDEAGLRNDAGYIAEGYVNHVWDKAKSDPKAWDNYVRTRSANMKHREIETYREGRDIGLVPKYTDIIDILSHYSRQNNEAIANKTMLDAIAYTNVEEVNSDGEVVATVPLLTSRGPDLFTRDYYGKPYEIPSLGNVWVHRSSESIFATVFGPIRQQGVAPWVTKTGRFYDLLGSTLKKINLSLSGFHALALTETAIAQMGPVGTARALFKEILWDSALMGKGKPAYAHPEDFTFAAKHLVSLGATQDYAAADVQILTERLRNAVRNLAHDPNLMKKGAGYAIMPLTEALDFINKGMDAFLWDYIHDGLKVSCMRMLRKQIDRRAAKKDLPADMVEKMYDEAGQYVNDIFGGQYWELLNVSPATVKWAGRLIMSPDWNVSTTRQALAMTGFGSLYSEQGFKGWLKYHMDNIKRMAGKDIPHDEYRRVRSMNAKVFWLLSLPMIYAVMNALNAIARKGDEEEEQAKAEEMRKANPDYKSPYELAHPEGMKWYDYFMFGNSIGQQTHLFNGRYIDGTERYIRWGKQFRELPEMFIGRHGVEFPTPMIERLMGKANPVIGYVRDGFGSLGVHGFTTPYDVKEDVAKHGKTIALLSVTAKRFLPYSVPTQEDKEFKFLDLFMPSSKGFSPWKAQDYYKTFILAGDMHGVEQTYQACVMNGIDAEKTLQAAIASIRANQRKELSDGVTDLGIAFDRFNETHDLLERRTLRNKIVKYLAEQSYKTFSREEALQKAQSVMDGENMAQAEKDADNYILACSAEDVRDDYRLTALMQQSKQYSDRLSQLRNEGIEEAVIKEYAERHGNWLQMRKMITAGRRQMNKLKKQLGQGNDETVMEQIRDVRGKLFIQIDGLDPQKK